MLSGKAWAAVKDGRINLTISMKVPAWVDFDKFREKARECLSLAGEVKTGEIIERDGEFFFVQRLSHKNRGKSERKPVEYKIRR